MFSKTISYRNAMLKYVSRDKPFILLASLWLAACGSTVPAQPDLPASVSPGWTRTLIEHLPEPPPGVSKDGNPDCWKATYSGPGTATATVCSYKVETSAFEALQRTRAEANTVKFQSGSRFILIHWTTATRDEIAILIRGVQKALIVK